MSLAPSSLDFSLSSTPNFSSAFGGGVKRPGFFGSLGNAISQSCWFWSANWQISFRRFLYN